MYNFGDVPDDFITKRHMIFNRTLWKIFQQFGWEKVLEGFEVGTEAFTYETFKYRLDDAVKTAKKVISGDFEFPEKLISYTLFPPGGFIRSDLQQGSMKLMYGESVDVSYIAIWDLEQTIYSILNAHLEDGIPVDWYLLGPEDEILERRHMKTGVKLKDMPKKNKGRDFNNLGKKITEILKDLRNERTPEFSSSTYMVGLTWASHAAHLPFIFSYYEALARLWDLLAAKKNTGLEGFAYVPASPTIQMLAYMSRPDYIIKSAGLLSDHKMYIIGLEEQNRDFLLENLPEDYDLFINEKWHEGLPWPYQTVNVQTPYEKMKKKNAWKHAQTNNTFEWNYSHPENFIKLEDLGMDLDQVMNGVFLDINHSIEPNSVNLKDKMISTGCGQFTEFI
ncbi:MAG: hypothetical protein HWN67_07935 [Candidatus Helarchaeota archaeon]|nr:hypothetical protein [Candidatus Helarchaeota archaeon]